MRPMELTRAGILGTIVVLVAAAVCVRLGLWQLDRRGERLARNAAIAERLAEDPLRLAGWPEDTTGLTWRRVVAEGRFDAGRSVVLAGRSYRGAPGVQLLTPLRTRDGAVLVNRGWLPSPDASTIDRSGLDVPGAIVVEGVLQPFPPVDREAEPGGGFRDTWYRLDGDGIRAQYPYSVAPLYLQATARPAPADDGLRASGAAPDSAASELAPPGGDAARSDGGPVILDPPSLDAGPHLSYAVQWFSFATIFLVGWLVMLLRGSGRPG